VVVRQTEHLRRAGSVPTIREAPSPTKRVGAQHAAVGSGSAREFAMTRSLRLLEPQFHIRDDSLEGPGSRASQLGLVSAVVGRPQFRSLYTRPLDTAARVGTECARTPGSLNARKRGPYSGHSGRATTFYSPDRRKRVPLRPRSRAASLLSLASGAAGISPRSSRERARARLLS
jgi:hypothetical protein